MARLVLNDDQIATIEQADLIEVVDQRGRTIMTLVPLVSQAELKSMREALASNQPRYTTDQVLARLASLSEG